MIAGPVKVRKKLIEVALPLEAINIASAREKSIRHAGARSLTTADDTGIQEA